MHRKAVLTLVVCCLLWSVSGIVTRQLQDAAGFEAVFWRSFFAALAVGGWLLFERGRRLAADIRAMGRVGLVSGVLWSVMLTCFMFALLLTTVAKAMVMLAITPLLAAILAWVILGERVPGRTWGAIVVAGAGIVWMVSDALGGDERYPHSAWGLLVASALPLASALNLVFIKQAQARVDMMPALLIGASISAAAMLPFAAPFVGTAADIAWLAFLGAFQIALPGLLFIRAARHLPPGEAGLLILLEVVFAPLWVWVGAGERPTDATLAGGVIVLAALVVNELLGARRRPAPPVMPQ